MSLLNSLRMVTFILVIWHPPLLQKKVWFFDHFSTNYSLFATWVSFMLIAVSQSNPVLFKIERNISSHFQINITKIFNLLTGPNRASWVGREVICFTLIQSPTSYLAIHFRSFDFKKFKNKALFKLLILS